MVKPHASYTCKFGGSNAVGNLVGRRCTLGGQLCDFVNVEGGVASTHIWVVSPGLQKSCRAASALTRCWLGETHRKLSVACTPLASNDATCVAYSAIRLSRSGQAAIQSVASALQGDRFGRSSFNTPRHYIGWAQPKIDPTTARKLRVCPGARL